MEKELLINTSEETKSNWVDQLKIYCACAVGITFLSAIFIAIIFGFDIAGLSIAFTNNNATQYEHKIVMSLNIWLSIVSGTSMSFIILLFLTGMMLCACGTSLHMIGAVYMTYSFCFGIFVICFDVIGIIELVYQFSDAPGKVCVMVIIMLFVKSIAAITFFLVVHYFYEKC